MSRDSMYMNTDNMKLLADSLNSKIIALKEVYQSVDSRMKELDGSNDTWKGENQKKFYETFSTSLDKFPKNIEKLEDFHKFLTNTIKDYETRDSDINKEIDNGDDKFGV